MRHSIIAAMTSLPAEIYSVETVLTALRGSLRFHPNASRHIELDPAVAWAIRVLVHPGLFWIPEATKRSRPFRTSMLARLPWRAITGGLALATGTAAGACFALANLLWALGDVAIGALDTVPEPLEAASARQRRRRRGVA